MSFVITKPSSFSSSSCACPLLLSSSAPACLSSPGPSSSASPHLPSSFFFLLSQLRLLCSNSWGEIWGQWDCRNLAPASEEALAPICPNPIFHGQNFTCVKNSGSKGVGSHLMILVQFKPEVVATMWKFALSVFPSHKPHPYQHTFTEDCNFATVLSSCPGLIGCWSASCLLWCVNTSAKIGGLFSAVPRSYSVR